MKLHIKRIIMGLLSQLICLLPDKPATALIDALYAIRPSLLLQLLAKLPHHVFETKACDYVGIYTILTENELRKYAYRVIDPERIEAVPLPYVYGLSTGGSYSILKSEITLYKFTNAMFHPFSDAIRVGNKVYWEKSARTQFTKLIPADRDLVSYDRHERSLLLKKFNQVHKIKSGFSLSGVHVNSWGHFIGNFFPKMLALKEIDVKDLAILVPSNVDDHIKGLVELCAKRLGPYAVHYLDPNMPVECESLYYCSSPSYLADHADYLHLADILISQYAINALHDLVGLVRHESSPSGNRKIFIGRTGYRNLENYKEVEALFVNFGFEVVYPHRLTLSEKIAVFEEASHIAGPASSGFANWIFSRPGTKALAFINFARSLDLYSGPFMQAPFHIKSFFVTGEESYASNVHNSYRISLDRIQAALSATEFLS